MTWPFKPSESHTEGTLPDDVQRLIEKYQKMPGCQGIDLTELARRAVVFARASQPQGLEVTGEIDQIIRQDGEAHRVDRSTLVAFAAAVADAVKSQGAVRSA